MTDETTTSQSPGARPGSLVARVPASVGPSGQRVVSLREEHDGRDHRYLDAYLDAEGNLHIDGQDLGPATAVVSSDGEYEWFETIRASDLPALRRLLRIPDGVDLLDALAAWWSGPRAGLLELILNSSGFPLERTVWSG